MQYNKIVEKLNDCWIGRADLYRGIIVPMKAKADQKAATRHKQ